MKDDDLTPYERAARNLSEPAGWDLAATEGRLDSNDVLSRLVNMALYEFGSRQDDWPIAFDQDGFVTALTAEGIKFESGLSIYVWPNDHPPPHVHILKKSERDDHNVKINLESGEVIGELPRWAKRKQLARIKDLVIENHETLADLWSKYHGITVTLLT